MDEYIKVLEEKVENLTKTIDSLTKRLEKVEKETDDLSCFWSDNVDLYYRLLELHNLM